MSDDRVERRLRKYRPVSPPADLRDRVTHLAPARMPWAAIAALLVVTLVLRVLASAERLMMFEKAR
jgi:hypothetical protein